MTITLFRTPSRLTPVDGNATIVAVTTERVTAGHALGGDATPDITNSSLSSVTLTIPSPSASLISWRPRSAWSFSRHGLRLMGDDVRHPFRGGPTRTPGRPAQSTVAATVPLRLLTPRKGVNEMPRNPTMADRLEELLMDVEAGLRDLANADGVITTSEAELMTLVRRASIKSQRLRRGIIMAKNVMDNAEVNDNVIRQDREMKRDIAALEMGAPLVHLSEYRAERYADTPA